MYDNDDDDSSRKYTDTYIMCTNDHMCLNATTTISYSQSTTNSFLIDNHKRPLGTFYTHIMNIVEKISAVAENTSFIYKTDKYDFLIP